MHIRRRPISFRGLLILGTVAAAACNDNAGTTTLDDAALRGATVGEVETLVADNPDGTSERLHFLNTPGPDGARLRLVVDGR